MKICRDRQKQILDALAQSYPDSAREFIDKDDPLRDYANLFYLQEHGLVQASIKRALSGAHLFSGASITAKGLDFLADDGGLSAILGTVTVRVHADSIKALLASRIEQSDLPAEQKSWLRTQVDTLSDESLRTVTKSLIEQGIDRVPDLYQWAKLVFGIAP